VGSDWPCAEKEKEKKTKASREKNLFIGDLYLA